MIKVKDRIVPQVPNSFRGTDMYEPGVDQQLIARECLQYAIRRFDTRRKAQIGKINGLYNRYNGVMAGQSLDWYNKTYGTDNAIKFVDWRLGKVKIDLMVGEMITRPLKASCYTINSASRTEKLETFHAQIGLKYAGDKVSKITEATGVKPFDGMNPLQGTPDEIFQQANAKNKNEICMQIILNKVIENERMKQKLASNYFDVNIAAECFSKTYIDNHGIVRHREIDSRDALFQEAERDPFLLQSPYLGERRLMVEHDVYRNFDLDKDDREYVKNMFTSKEGGNITNTDTKTRESIYLVGQHKAIETFTIEYYSIKPIYTLVSKNKAGEPVKREVDISWYNDSVNQKKIQNEVKNGRMTIDTRYKLVLWEISQIGYNLFTEAREVPNIIGNLENPYETVSNYSGMLFNTVDGIRVSLQQNLDHLSELYNIVMMQIRREINKSKGKVLPYDRRNLPKGMTMKQVMSKVINEGILDYNSAEDGNDPRRAQSITNMFKEIDLGASQSISLLIEVKREIEATADRLTGINDNRQGDIAASSTATNANSAIQISRTITEYQFYMFSEYVENVLKKAMELGKVAYGILNPDLGKMLLGDEAVRFLNEIKDISNDSFGLQLEDGRKEQDLRRKMDTWIQQSINAGELRFVDAMAIEMSETVKQGMLVAENGWKIVKEIAAKSQQEQQQAKSLDEQRKINAMLDDKLAQRRHELDRDILQGLIKSGLMTQEAVDQYQRDMKMAQFTQEQVDAEQKQLLNTGS